MRQVPRKSPERVSSRSRACRWLTSGKKFDSSIGGKPFEFRIGNGDVIKGWEEGVSGMKVGGKRQLKIPPDLAYGKDGYPGAIPPNATLVFDIQLVGIQ
jgi:FKBP-type peptidyl-prolyl cis-trans isomerase